MIDDGVLWQELAVLGIVAIYLFLYAFVAET